MKNPVTVSGIAALLSFALVSTGCASPSPESKSAPADLAGSYKPRVIHTTDLGADPDDEESLVRCFVTCNEFDIEGLVVVTSCWKNDQNSTAMLDKIVNAYGQVVTNLNAHAKDFPTLEYFRSVSKLGQKGYSMGDVGAGKDSPGSDLIIAAVDKPDPRPVWVTLWGGGNTLAQALWKVQNTRTPAELAKFVSKLRVYDILGQDETGAWMTKTFPNLLYMRALNMVYAWQPSGDWVKTNIQSHGPLGACYKNKAWSYEGDTPAFLYMYPNGLSNPEHPDWGSWGGRFDPVKKTGIRGMVQSKKLTAEPSYDPYYMYADAPEGGKSISRWAAGIHNDFQARMDWTMTGKYSEANHHPIAVVNGDTTRQVLEIPAKAGAKVALTAAGSSDPDKNALVYAWSFYQEPSSYKGTVTVQDNASATPTVVIPADAAGKDIHVILELHDNGSPNLYAYRRVIVHVR
jgi:hypothetical protein